MNVNVSGKLNINILNNKQRIYKSLPFHLVFTLYHISDLLLAINDLVAHINSGATRKTFINKINSIIQARNNFIYNKSYITELKNGLILTIALRKFVELIYDRKHFLKVVCYFLDKELCKFPLTMGEFNSYRRTHPTHISDSSLYYKFNTLSKIFNHLDVFVHLLVAGNPILIAKQNEIRRVILQKKYREFYNLFASELNIPIEDAFFWCCDYEVKNKKSTSNPQPTPTPQSNTSQPTPTPQANSSQPTPTPNSIDIEDVFNIYDEACLKKGIETIINNRDSSIEDIIEKISIFMIPFTAPNNPFRTSNNQKYDPDGSILKNFLTELANIIRDRLMFTRLISVYLDMEIYKKKSKHNITPEEVINGLEINNELRTSSIEKSIENIKFLEKLFVRLPIFGFILQKYYICVSKTIIKLINNNDYNNLYRLLITDPKHPIEKLFYWCHKFDTENNKVIPEPENIKVQSVFEPEVTNTISEPEAINSTFNPQPTSTPPNPDNNQSSLNAEIQTNLKYKLTTNKYIVDNWTCVLTKVTLYQIEALVDIKRYNVKVGDLGGFIESELNLSQLGDCWVNDTARVYGNAQIQDDAQIYGNANINENVKVSGDSQIYGNADISGNVKIYGYAQIYDNAEVKHDVCISDNVQVYDNSCIYNEVVLEDNVRISGSARIFSNSKISNNAWIKDNAVVNGNVKISDNVRVYGNARITGNVELFGNVQVFDRANIEGHLKLSGNTQVCNRTRLT